MEKKKEKEIIEGRKKRGNEQKGRLNFFFKKKKSQFIQWLVQKVKFPVFD